MTFDDMFVLELIFFVKATRALYASYDDHEHLPVIGITERSNRFTDRSDPLPPLLDDCGGSMRVQRGRAREGQAWRARGLPPRR